MLLGICFGGRNFLTVFTFSVFSTTVVVCLVGGERRFCIEGFGTGRTVVYTSCLVMIILLMSIERTFIKIVLIAVRTCE